MTELKTYEEIDWLLDEDTLSLRDYAVAITNELRRIQAEPKRSESQIYNDVMARY